MLTLESYYMVFYALYLVLIQAFKGYGGLRFPPHIWGMELAACVIFAVMQWQRLKLGMIANRNEHHKATMLFTIFTLLCMLFYCYFALYTTYVLVIDITVGIPGAVICVFEALIGLRAFCVFREKAKL